MYSRYDQASAQHTCRRNQGYLLEQVTYVVDIRNCINDRRVIDTLYLFDFFLADFYDTICE